MSPSSHRVECTKNVRALMRACFSLAKRDQLRHEQVILAAPARAGEPGFEGFAFGRRLMAMRVQRLTGVSNC